MENNCIFCKIVAGQIPKHAIYEDDQFLAFLDIEPRAKGHTLVIPKKHMRLLADLDDKIMCDILPTVKKVQDKLASALKPDAFNIGWNDGEAAGQVVPHLHIHIKPRWENDGGTSMHAVANKPGEERLEDLAQYINNHS